MREPRHSSDSGVENSAMESLAKQARAHYDLALTYLKPSALRCRKVIAAQFKKQPHLSSAALVVGLGFLAILFQLPTKDGSVSLAGALFGAGAAFIGAWVTENNRAAAEKADDERRKEAARLYFTPEFARIVAQQVNIMGRLVPNFIAASVGRAMPQVETWEVFRPARPVLYPTAVQFRDLSEADAAALINFYDSVHGIAETIDKWIETTQQQEVNAWHFLMQSVQNSLSIGAIAVTQFCPDRQLSPIAPASGTLLQNIERTASSMQRALDAHMARHQAQAAARKP
jgi:hypothetical protein